MSPAIDETVEKLLDRRLTLTFAVACGLAVANLYYAQPLLGVLGDELHCGTEQMGLIVTLTQLGYALGLLFLVPLGDLLENKRLILRLFWLTVLALLAASCAGSFWVFALASLIIGFTSVVAQVLVPLAASLATAAQRGQVVGQVMSGLLIGVLLARAVSGYLADLYGWRSVFRLAAVLLILLNLWLSRVLPGRQPVSNLSYWQLLGSLLQIFRENQALRQRSLYQMMMFGSFSAFWTGLTFWLSVPPWNFSLAAIGRLALIGVTGAMAAPWFGRQGDKGRGRLLTGICLLGAPIAFALTLIKSMAALIIAILILDACVQGCLILGQQQVFQLNPQEHNRLNTLYISIFFLGGALASAGSGLAFAHYGWTGVVGLGCILPGLAFFCWLGERPTAATPALKR